ncbi:hypothetical protein PVAND_011172 [Polypedilum vanderplanki]|uniref:MADF domain-containing protein n=1 Tax=Polypedilum vanderplanki TaxID=319348 RepID=A0A9J6CJ56_POLVA|nr:hypothetical protein PVAND_011172 [Polypedilum vanderplanki]
MSKKIISNPVELLIDAVKNYPILYSKISSVNNEDKNQAWIHIANSLNEENVQSVKSKWRNLRDSYLKAIRNKRELQEINQLSRYHPYKHEERMNFLYPYILQEINQRKRKTVKMIDTGEIKQDRNSYVYAIEQQSVEYLIETEEECERVTLTEEEEEEEREVEGDGEEEPINEEEEVLLEENDADSTLLQMESECYEEEDAQQHPIIQEQKYHNCTKNNDEADIEAWLTSIRETMRNLNKINRAKVKRDINNILSKYEIEQYEAELKTTS